MQHAQDAASSSCPGPVPMRHAPAHIHTQNQRGRVAEGGLSSCMPVCSRKPDYDDGHACCPDAGAACSKVNQGHKAQ
eukprot:55400-Chlamydomonas_euryale.AAC.7